MIRGIKTRTLKNNSYGLDNFLESLFIAFRAASQRRIAKFLLLVEYKTTICASIAINRHYSPLQSLKSGILQHEIIALMRMADKVWDRVSNKLLIVP